ncbi:MAG: PAS domain-containing sensor histidine kinase [Desulfocurvibacter africanus]
MYAQWETQEILSSIIMSLPIGICITDNSGMLVFFNQRYLDIYGYTKDELHGKSFLVVVPPENRRELRALHDSFIKGEVEELPASWDVVKKNGAIIQIKATAVRFVGNDGLTYKLTTVSDITELKRLERLKDDAQRILQHDLRSPLTCIISSVNILLENQRLDGEDREYANWINESSQRLLRMTSRALDIYKMETNTYNLNSQTVSILEILMRVDRELTDLKDRYKVATEISRECIPSHMQDAIQVNGDKDLLTAMFTNLIKNAIEASPANKIVTITIRYGIGLTIDIHNYGTIPEVVRNKFFERYITSKQWGTGLGTYSALLIARTHGGDIQFTTSEENGTHIIVRIPVPSCMG